MACTTKDQGPRTDGSPDVLYQATHQACRTKDERPRTKGSTGRKCCQLDFGRTHLVSMSSEALVLGLWSFVFGRTHLVSKSSEALVFGLWSYTFGEYV